MLVGDHNQLPPLVQKQEARQRGLDVSLFKMLSDAHPMATVELCTQYRMNGDIMQLSNTLVYDHKLVAGSQQVARQCLSPPLLRNVASRLTAQRKWLLSVLDPARRVVVLDTDQVGASLEQAGNGSGLYNPTECAVLAELIDTFGAAGCSMSQLGIISPYQSQLKAIRKRLGPRPGLEISTVDKYQGSDKDCVLLSLVRSNSGRKVGRLLEDWRRVNVAFTRAKCKLIILGSLSTLQESPAFVRFVQLVRNQNWVLQIPKDAELQHIDGDTREENSLALVSEDGSKIKRGKRSPHVLEKQFPITLNVLQERVREE